MIDLRKYDWLFLLIVFIFVAVIFSVGTYVLTALHCGSCVTVDSKEGVIETIQSDQADDIVSEKDEFSEGMIRTVRQMVRSGLDDVIEDEYLFFGIVKLISGEIDYGIQEINDIYKSDDRLVFLFNCWSGESCYLIDYDFISKNLVLMDINDYVVPNEIVETGQGSLFLRGYGADIGWQILHYYVYNFDDNSLSIDKTCWCSGESEPCPDDWKISACEQEERTVDVVAHRFVYLKLGQFKLLD